MADTPVPVRVAYFCKTRWGAHAEFVEFFTRVCFSPRTPTIQRSCKRRTGSSKRQSSRLRDAALGPGRTQARWHSSSFVTVGICQVITRLNAESRPWQCRPLDTGKPTGPI